MKKPASKNPAGSPRHSALMRSALALLTVVFVVACGGTKTGGPPNSPEAPTQSAPPTGSAGAGQKLTFDQVIDVLAEGGIPVYADPDDPEPLQLPAEPVSPSALQAFQVEQLVRDHNTGGGVSGPQIDELLPMPADTVPYSLLLAGYVATAQTPGSRLAAALMADQDLEHREALWFPTIVLVTFVGETAGALAAEGAVTGRVDAVADVALLDDHDVVLAAADPCGAFSSFLAGTLQAVQDAILSVVPRIPFLKAAIEWALKEGIGLAVEAATELVGRLTFLKAIADGVKLLALAATVLTSLRDWKVPVTADPGMAHYSVGSTVNSVTMTAHVEDGPGDLFSVPVRNCAKLAGIALPEGGAVGSTVEWRILDGAFHMAPGLQQETTVPGTKRVKFSFTMTDEPSKNHEAPGPIVLNPIRVQVIVKRQDVAQVKAMIQSLIKAEITAPVWNALVGHFGDPIDKLTSWTNPASVGLAVAEHHLEPTPSPTPSISPSAPPSNPGTGPNSEFCRIYRALLAWSQNPTYEELSREWARYIDAEGTKMRAVAPPEMVEPVKAFIAAYAVYGYADEPGNVPLSGPHAAKLGIAVLAMHDYCGIPLDMSEDPS